MFVRAQPHRPFGAAAQKSKARKEIQGGADCKERRKSKAYKRATKDVNRDLREKKRLGQIRQKERWT